jgi:hypothetical protein
MLENNSIGDTHSSDVELSMWDKVSVATSLVAAFFSGAMSSALSGIKVAFSFKDEKEAQAHQESNDEVKSSIFKKISAFFTPSKENHDNSVWRGQSGEEYQLGDVVQGIWNECLEKDHGVSGKQVKPTSDNKTSRAIPLLEVLPTKTEDKDDQIIDTKTSKDESGITYDVSDAPVESTQDELQQGVEPPVAEPILEQEEGVYVPPGSSNAKTIKE